MITLLSKEEISQNTHLAVLSIRDLDEEFPCK